MENIKPQFRQEFQEELRDLVDKYVSRNEDLKDFVEVEILDEMQGILNYNPLDLDEFEEKDFQTCFGCAKEQIKMEWYFRVVHLRTEAIMNQFFKP